MKSTSRYLRVAVSVGLLALVAWHTDWPSFTATLSRLRVEVWLLATGLLCVTQVVSALRWRVFAGALGFRASVARLSAFYFIGMYFNLLLPTSVGGDVARACYLGGGPGRRLAAALSVFLDRLSGLFVLLAFACLAVLFSPLDLPAWIPWSVVGLTALILGGLAGLLLVAHRRGGRSKRLQQTKVALLVLRRPRIFLATTALSLFVQGANVVIVMIVGAALALSAPGSFYWVLVPMVSLLTLLPISVNGMGVREGATALLLAPLGVDQGAALGLALAWFAVHLLVSLLGGLVYLFGRFPTPRAAAEQSRPDEVSNHHASFRSDPDQGRAREYQSAV